MALKLIPWVPSISVMYFSDTDPLFLVQYLNHSIKTYRHRLWRILKFKCTYLLGCLVILQQIVVSEGETFRVPELQSRSLFIQWHYLSDFFNELSRHFSTNSVLWRGLSSCFNFLQGEVECVFEWRARLALFHSHEDSFTVAHSLLWDRVARIEELMAANRHASESIGGILSLSHLDHFHCWYARVKHVNCQQIPHESIETVLLLWFKVVQVELLGSHCLSPQIDFMPECLEAECTDQILLLVDFVVLLVQAEGLLVVRWHY